ncbi:unnamed protein product [Penicillium salamii]|uniref:Uncharacterized protein n=1 Tax=Penicillium salamii TaxID=1612424 RepID=A0A9W4J580_9EURO|nr:unnamed protein product [Penicillium salamii]CAG8190394.1 unnamed protein product [Penicillium salamii]CAG8260318.1 unnamed protein product [Penicillium salamii]CAG8315313.1 unnamed protein product [Penicillium salamii]CAG8370209.1 unnamed protein product [Penicillium salamii]
MASNTHLTKGLRHILRPRLLKSGEAFVIRYKNPLRNHKTDVWIGVILPHMFGPESHSKRRPPFAQPEEGDWTKHPKDRVYSVYLPGRNMYRWVGFNDMFILDEWTFNVMRKMGRQDESKVWDDLVEIMGTKPDMSFWKEMSLQEVGTKGKRGREVYIVMPYKDGEGHDAEEEEEEEGSGGEAGSHSLKSELGDMEESPSKVQATKKSFSASRKSYKPSGSPNIQGIGGRGMSEVPQSEKNIKSETDDTAQQPRVLQPRRQTGSRLLINQDPASRSLSSALSSTTKSFHPGSVVSRLTLDCNVPMVAGESSPSPGSPSPTAKDHYTKIDRVLQQVINDDVSWAFHQHLEFQKQPEFRDLRTWVIHETYRPHVELPDPTEDPQDLPEYSALTTANGETVIRVLGDILNLNQEYRLRGFRDPKTRQEGIVSLGIIYQHIKSLVTRDQNMQKLVSTIARKLQIAWNSYAGISLCQPLLNIAFVAFGDGYDHERPDLIQQWFFKFFAQTFAFFYHDCHEKFLEFLRADEAVQKQIFDLRAEFNRRQPIMNEDIRVLLMTRRIFHL